MEPSTKIHAGTAHWLGLMAVICTVLAEMLALAHKTHRLSATDTNRARTSRTIRHAARAR
jgi:hypothetical protein